MPSKPLAPMSATQHGLTLGSLLLLLILVAPAAGFAIKVVPVYVDHNLLVSATRSLVETRGSTLTQSQLRLEVADSLRINNVRQIDPRRAITLTHISGRPQARIRYERRVPLIYNIDVIVSFDELID